MEDERPPEPVTQPPSSPSVALQVGVEDMVRRLGLGTERRPRVGRDGRFELISCLGRGGMGEVYLAHDTVLERDIAVKIVVAQYRHSPRLRQRLLREAKTLARLAHPNVLEVYDVDTAPTGELVVAVAYVRGQTLATWQEGQSLRAILRVYLEAGRGLAAAHAAGIIHRDFKPSNVLIADDGSRVVVSDFGLAAEIRSAAASDGSEPIGGDGHSSETGTLLGTQPFMAPELIAGHPATVASDQYAYCVSLWQAVTGARPFAGLERGPLPARPRVVPRWLYRVLQRGLADQPHARFLDMQGLLAALERGLRRPRVIGSTATLVGVVATVAAAWWPKPPQPPIDPCADAPAPIMRIWTEPRRAALQQQFGAEHHVLAVFDGSASSWTRRATATCTTLQDDPTNAQALAEHACLTRWLDSFARRVEVVTARPHASNVHALLQPLWEIERNCQVLTPALDPRVQAVLDDAEDHRLLRQLDTARELAESAVALAERHGAACRPSSPYSYELGEAHYQLAEILSSLDSSARARAELALARKHALGCQQLELLVRIWTLEAKLLAVDFERAHEAAPLLDDVGDTLLGLGMTDTSVHRVELHEARALVARAFAHWDDAIAQFEQALALLGDDAAAFAMRAKLLGNIGAAHQDAGRPAQALASYQAAAELVAETLDEDHPETLARRVTVAMNSIQIDGEHRASSAEWLEQALPRIHEPVLRGQARVHLSQYWSEMQQPKRALTQIHALAGELEQLHDVPLRTQGEMLTEVGQVLLDSEPSRSVPLLERAIELWRELDDHENLDISEALLARALLALDRHDEARVHASAVLNRATNEQILAFAQAVIDDANLPSGHATQPRE